MKYCFALSVPFVLLSTRGRPVNWCACNASSTLSNNVAVDVVNIYYSCELLPIEHEEMVALVYFYYFGKVSGLGFFLGCPGTDSGAFKK